MSYDLAIQMISVFLFLSLFYYLGVYLRNYRETRKTKFPLILVISGIYGLFETMLLNYVIFEVLFSPEGVTDEVAVGKQLIGVILVCLRGGYAYKESLGTLVQPRKTLIARQGS